MENKDRPIHPVTANVFSGAHIGLTKREYFAGLAMQGLLANSNYNHDFFWVSDRAIKYADELLKQLND